MVGPDANQGCPKSPHLVPEGCHRQQEPFLVKGKPRCARLSFHKRKGFYRGATILALQNLFFLGKGKASEARPLISVE